VVEVVLVAPPGPVLVRLALITLAKVAVQGVTLVVVALQAVVAVVVDGLAFVSEARILQLQEVAVAVAARMRIFKTSKQRAEVAASQEAIWE